MKTRIVAPLVAVVGLLAICSPLFAHHGNAAFSDKLTTLKQATVTKFSWANPHSLIEFDAKDDKGKMQHWVVETAAPQALVLIGWSKSSLEPGDVISVYMYQAKTGNPADASTRSYSPMARSCMIPSSVLTAAARLDTTIRMAKHPGPRNSKASLERSWVCFGQRGPCCSSGRTLSRAALGFQDLFCKLVDSRRRD